MLVPVIVRSQPGVRRDGTTFASDFYIDAQWVRFQRQLVRKMAGYIAISHYLRDISRGIITFVQDNYTYVFSGSKQYLDYFYLDIDANASVIINRTPVNLVANENNSWQFDIILDAGNLRPVNQIVAQVAPNGKNIANTIGGQLFLGDLVDPNQAGSPLEDISWALDSQYISISGGVFSLHPYLVVFGNDGTVAWSAPGRPKWFNQFQFIPTDPAIRTIALGAKGNSYVIVPPDSALIEGELITFGSAEPVPYVYYGIRAIGQIGQVIVTLQAPVVANYPAGTPICQFYNYPRLLIASALGSGNFYCEIDGDYAAYFKKGVVMSFLPFGGTTYYIVESSFYSAGTSRTTVRVDREIASPPAIGTSVWLLQDSGYVLNTDMPLGALAFGTDGVSVGVFPNNNYLGFGTPLSIANANEVYQVSASVTISVNAITLSDPLQANVPAGTRIFVQGTVATGAGNARVAGQKLVKGISLRGGPGNSPSALLWSTDALLRMAFVGGELVFQFDTISPSSSILSASSVIEFDGVYYWVGSDRFLMFNGVVRELPNDMNINWFFDNINRQWKNRVFAFKVPRFAEIWWCFPFGNATECTHAVIYNIRENTWYDTKLPNGGRAAGQFMASYGRPLLMGVEPQDDPYGVTGYLAWQHEQGTDEVDGQLVSPIEAYFETASFSLHGNPQGKLKNLRVAVVEPDFLQKGDMTVSVIGQANPRAKTVSSAEIVFSDTAVTAGGQIACFKEERRLLRFRFRSNATSGDFQMGKIIAQVEEADGTYLGAVNASN